MKIDDEDPIKEHRVGSIFSFPKNNFEDDVEYDYKEYDYNTEADDKYDYNSSFWKTRKMLISATVYAIIFIIIVGALYNYVINSFGIVTTYLKQESSETNQDKGYYFAHVNDFTHEDLIIPTLYKYTGYDLYTKVTNMEPDNRFGNNTVTIEIEYEVIPPKRIMSYTNGLVSEGFYYVGKYGNGNVYSKKINNGENFGFVIIEEDRVIYNVGTSDYEKVLLNIIK